MSAFESYVFVCVCMCVCMYLYVCVRAYVCVCVCVPVLHVNQCDKLCIVILVRTHEFANQHALLKGELHILNQQIYGPKFSK